MAEEVVFAFQFQIGAINRGLETDDIKALYKFQFQIGSINSRHHRQDEQVTSVSIPIWFD